MDIGVWIPKLLKLISKDSEELMSCLNTFHEKLDYKSCTQEMTPDHLEELELVMNDFEKSTLTSFQATEGAKFIGKANF